MQIYKITNILNNKIYIGKDTKDRPNYYGSGIVIKQSIKKYGIENFKKEILDYTNNYKELNEKEKYWIKKFKSYEPLIGYNRSFGGDGFSGITPETIEKIKRKNIGKKRSEIQKLNISKSLKNKPKSDKHKKSLSKAWNIRKIEKPHTVETIEKMRKSMIGKNKGKYVKIYEFENSHGERFITNEGIVKFSKKIHKQTDTLRKLIKGELEEYHGWKYIKTIKIN